MVITAWTVCKCLCAKSVSVSSRASVLVCVFICVSIDYDWGTGMCVSLSVRMCICMCVGVCERQRVLNMCWRSQRNSRALIRTSPGWQLVNSVLRIGVYYSYTKKCKLVPVPSGLWKPIHMARSLILCTGRGAPQCNFPQSKEEKTTRADDKAHPHSCFVCATAHWLYFWEFKHVWVFFFFCFDNKKSNRKV